MALILAAWAFVSVGCTSAEESEVGWTKSFGRPGWDVGKWVQQTADGGYILAGEPHWYGPVSFDVLPVKIDSNGNEYLKPGWTRDVIPKVTNSIIIRSAELSIEAANDTVVYGVDMVLTVQGVLNCWYYVVVTNVTVSRPPEIKPLGDVKALSGDAVISADAPNLAAWIKTGSDGIADVMVSTTAADKRTYMIKVYETPEDALGPLLTPDDPGGPTWANDADIVASEDGDSVNVTVVPPTVAFNVPAKVIVGEKVNIEGAIPVGQKVDVVIRDTEVVATDERVDEYKEFSVEWDTSEYLIGSYIIEGYIDFMVGMPKDLSSYEGVDPDGNATIRIIPPGLDATQPRDVVAEGDGYYFEGTATGVNAVDYVLVGPKGWKTGHAANVLGGIVKGAASVNDSEFSEDETMTEGLDLGVWVAVVLHPGRDGTYHKTGEGGGSLTLAALGVTDGKTQTQILEIVEDAITMAGSDDIMVTLSFRVSSAQEIRFTGTVTDKNPPGQVGALWWNVTAEEIISGPQTSCDTLRVDLILSPPIGYYESDIAVGDRVEVYGNYISNFCTVSLNGESYYIVGGPPSVHNLNTSEDFATIQAAINDSYTLSGHIITVDSGTHMENVMVNKPLTIKSSSGNPRDTIIYAANPSESAFRITASYVNFSGFTVKGATGEGESGIRVDFAYYCNITNNIILNNYRGVEITNSANNNTVDGNRVCNNTGYGISLGFMSHNNTIECNFISNNSAGGIVLHASSNNTITNNNIYKSGQGISISRLIYGFSSNNNHIMYNTISSNDCGIHFLNSSSNSIYLNDFINNTDNVLYTEIVTNLWNSTEKIRYVYNNATYKNYLGNYWDNYEDEYPDAEVVDGTGIWDTPYSIESDSDYYPLVMPCENYVKAPANQPPVASFSYSPVNPAVNETVTFNASASYDPDGSIVSYNWSFGDGNIADTTEAMITYSYASVGEYTVNLSVTDDEGATNKTSRVIKVFLDMPYLDTEPGTYPSICGIHNGTITMTHTVNVSTIFSYPCTGTGGHIEYARIWNSSWDGAEARWNGYVDDWHNCSFDKNFTLVAGETYNYTILTGSYPQVHHTAELLTAKGWIMCSEFVDVNGKRHEGWIPAIRLHN